jgi:hypothetical protein
MTLRLVKDGDTPATEEGTAAPSQTKEPEQSDLERMMRDEYSKKKQRLATMRTHNNQSVTRQYRLKK